MSIRRKIIENAEARKKNRLLNRNNNNVGNNNFASQGMKEKDYDFDRILAGDIPPELDKPHDDTLFFQIIFGAICLFVFYIPFWSGNGGVFTYLNEQTMLHLPSVYHIPDNIHTLWEKGEYNKGYEYNVKVKFSDELPFDIVRYLPENYLSFSIDIEHIIGQKNDTIKIHHNISLFNTNEEEEGEWDINRRLADLFDGYTGYMRTMHTVLC